MFGLGKVVFLLFYSLSDAELYYNPDPNLNPIADPSAGDVFLNAFDSGNGRVDGLSRTRSIFQFDHGQRQSQFAFFNAPGFNYEYNPNSNNPIFKTGATEEKKSMRNIDRQRNGVQRAEANFWNSGPIQPFSPAFNSQPQPVRETEVNRPQKRGESLCWPFCDKSPVSLSGQNQNGNIFGNLPLQENRQLLAPNNAFGFGPLQRLPNPAPASSNWLQQWQRPLNSAEPWWQKGADRQRQLANRWLDVNSAQRQFGQQPDNREQQNLDQLPFIAG